MYRLFALTLLLWSAVGWTQPYTVGAQTVRPTNWGGEWGHFPTIPTPAGSALVMTCFQPANSGPGSHCITTPAGSVIESIAFDLTNYQQGQTALFTLIASPDGTPWHPEARRLASRVVYNQTGQPHAQGVVPGRHYFPQAMYLWWAIFVHQDPSDARLPHVEHGTTIYVAE